MWKPDWVTTRKHMLDWWDRKGLVIGMWGGLPMDGTPHATTTPPPTPESLRDGYVNGELRARRNHHTLAHQTFPLDIIPVSETDIGPGSLALLLGSEPGFVEDTVWFDPSMAGYEQPETLPPFRFDETNPWWRVTETTLAACAKMGRGNYFAGCPDLIENIDILAALRGPQACLMDMIDRPEWVEEKVAEINEVWFAACQRIYDIIKDDDGGSVFGAFRLWAPGKVAKLQCDASAMFSPVMFRRFVQPGLAAQCAWLDRSMYHLDGTQAMGHLDALLEIGDLDAIEWTPQSSMEGGGHPRWFPMYRRILAAGKSLQIVNITPAEIIPLLDAIGGHGVYVITNFSSVDEAEAIGAAVEASR